MITLAFLLTAIVVCIAPGTGVIYTLSVALGRGWASAMAAVVGCTAGILPHLAAAVLGLAAVLHASALAFQVVKFAGVAFLLWMAWKTLRQGARLDGVRGERGGAGPVAIAVRGLLLNVLNPKLSVFFLAFLPQFTDPARGDVALQMTLLGAVFCAITFVVFTLYAAFASAARSKVLQSPQVMKWLNRAFAAAFGALALRLAGEGRGG